MHYVKNRSTRKSGTENYKDKWLVKCQRLITSVQIPGVRSVGPCVLRALALHWYSFPLISMGEPMFKKSNYKNAKKKRKSPLSA